MTLVLVEFAGAFVFGPSELFLYKEFDKGSGGLKNLKSGLVIPANLGKYWE